MATTDFEQSTRPLRDRIQRLQAQIDAARAELSRADAEYNTLHNAEAEAQRKGINGGSTSGGSTSGKST